MKISRLPWLRRNAKYVVFNLPGVYIHYTGCQNKRQLVDMADKKLPLILVYIHYTGCQNKRQLLDMADKKIPLILVYIHYTGCQNKRQLLDMADKKLSLILVYIHYTGCQNKRQLVDMADKKLPLILVYIYRLNQSLFDKRKSVHQDPAVQSIVILTISLRHKFVSKYQLK